VWDRINAAINLGLSGDQESARRRFGEIWEEIGRGGDQIQRCIVAHHMADVQDDPQAELAWDLWALEAADSITNEHRNVYPSAYIDGFHPHPSLHLSLAEDYRKIGNPAKAREHLAKAREHLARVGGLANMRPDDKYGMTIRAGLERLTELLDGPIK
jgi:hypothetical protein